MDLALIDPLYALLVRAALGLLLLGAAWHKLGDLPAFRTALADYRLLPVPAVPAASIAIIALEFLLGLCWLVLPYSAASAALTTLMLAAYAGGIAWNLLRGRGHIDCGCGFGTIAGSAPGLSWWLVLRNLALAAFAWLPALPSSGRPLGWLDWASLVGALLLAALLLPVLAQLRSNRAAMQRWRTEHV